VLDLGGLGDPKQFEPFYGLSEVQFARGRRWCCAAAVTVSMAGRSNGER
jgi:hypothetical protein